MAAYPLHDVSLQDIAGLSALLLKPENYYYFEQTRNKLIRKHSISSNLILALTLAFLFWFEGDNTEESAEVNDRKVRMGCLSVGA